MNAIEFQSNMGPNGEITLPPEFHAAIPEGEPVKVVVMWESDASWQTAASECFAAAYSSEDAVYEALLDATR